MSITPKQYAEEENQFLRSHYNIIGPKACSQRLERPYRSIVSQAYRLGLKSNKFKIAQNPSLNKICGHCLAEQLKTNFGQDKTRPDNLNPICKSCLQKDRNNKTTTKSAYDKIYRTQNSAKIQNYLLKNKEKIRIRKRLYSKKWRINPHNKVLQNLRTRVRIALKGAEKIHHTIPLLGCSIFQLKTHLESKFLAEMSWNNYGKDGWHIDHIKPCASFDLTDPQQQSECFHYSNLQPLWAKDNLIKGSKQLVS